MKPHESILMTLPESFSRQEFMNAVSETTAYSYSHAQNLLDNAIHEKLVVRTGRGEYIKQLEPELESR